MSPVLLVIYTAIIFFLVHRLKFFQLEGLGKWTPSLFFGFKLLAGIALWAVYTYYYTDRANSDIWKYFDDSKIMFDAIHSHPGDYFRMVSGIGDHTPEIEGKYYQEMNYWYRLFDNNLLNDAHIVIRFNAVVRLISMGNYFTHSLIMSFLSFIGLCCIYKIIFPVLRQWRGAAAGIIFLLPSLMFWSSGVMKEGLMIFGLGLLVYHSFRFMDDKKWWRIVLLLLGATLLLFSKFYVIVGVIPPLIATLLVIKNRKYAFTKFPLVLILFLGCSLSLRWIAPEREPLRLLANKQNEFLKMSAGGIALINDSVEVFIADDHREDLIKTTDSLYRIRPGVDFYYRSYLSGFRDTVFVKNNRDTSTYKLVTDIPRAGSLLNMHFLHPDLKSFVKETPQSFFNVLLRPFIWEAKNPIFLLPALENLLFIAMLVLIVCFRGKISNPEIFGFCISFSLLLLLVIGLTTPVLGALVRYRIAAQPFLFIAMLMLIDREKVMKKLPWLAKIGI
ncbi:MAG: hypothetical protein M3R17_14200 [Bacteroidota bacterium]|nr:hypothetical protein [Bacteroidota bacterium]